MVKAVVLAKMEVVSAETLEEVMVREMVPAKVLVKAMGLGGNGGDLT